MKSVVPLKQLLSLPAVDMIFMLREVCVSGADRCQALKSNQEKPSLAFERRRPVYRALCWPASFSLHRSTGVSCGLFVDITTVLDKMQRNINDVIGMADP